MDAKWTVISFKHRADGVHCRWTRSVINVTTGLTEEQLAQAAEWAENNDVWFSSKRTLFLCADAAEQAAVTNVLDAQCYDYDVELSLLTPEDKSIIDKAQVSNRNDIAGLLDVPRGIHWATVTAVDTQKARGITVARGSRTVECYGCLIPEIGDKVLVAFVDGDADKPCVISKVLGL